MLEEGWMYCGIGSEISATIMERGFDLLDAPVKRVAAKNIPLPYAENLEKEALPSQDDIYSAIKDIV